MFASPPRQQWFLKLKGYTANILCPISRFLGFSCDLIGSKWVFSTLGRWGQLRASILEITFYHVGRAQGWKIMGRTTTSTGDVSQVSIFCLMQCIFLNPRWLFGMFGNSEARRGLQAILFGFCIGDRFFESFFGTQECHHHRCICCWPYQDVIFPDVTNIFWGKLLASQFYPHGNQTYHIPSDTNVKDGFLFTKLQRLNNSFTMKGDFRHLKGQNGVPPQKNQKKTCVPKTQQKGLLIWGMPHVGWVNPKNPICLPISKGASNYLDLDQTIKFTQQDCLCRWLFHFFFTRIWENGSILPNIFKWVETTN